MASEASRAARSWEQWQAQTISDLKTMIMQEVQRGSLPGVSRLLDTLVRVAQSKPPAAVQDV